MSENLIKMVVGLSENMDKFGAYTKKMDDDAVKVGGALPDIWNTFAETN